MPTKHTKNTKDMSVELLRYARLLSSGKVASGPEAAPGPLMKLSREMNVQHRMKEQVQETECFLFGQTGRSGGQRLCRNLKPETYRRSLPWSLFTNTTVLDYTQVRLV